MPMTPASSLQYILSKSAAKNMTYRYVERTTVLYKDLHGKIASNQALSLCFHSPFFINPALDLPSELSCMKLPPINDTQMTKEIFAYGDNLSGVHCCHYTVEWLRMRPWCLLCHQICRPQPSLHLPEYLSDQCAISSHTNSK